MAPVEPVLARRRQLVAATGTEGQFTASVLDAANAIKVLDATFEPDVQLTERNPVRAQLGALAQVAGARFGKLNVDVECRGHGTAGTAPDWGVLLKACGWSETVQSGSASNTTPAGVAGLQNGTDISPAITGTYTGTKNGTFYIQIESITTDTSALLDVWFYPDDGTAASFYQTTHTDNSAQAIGSTGLSVAITNPGAGTTGWLVGDQWYFTATSDQSEQVIYKTADSSIPFLDMALYIGDNSGDAVIHKMHSCQGSWSIRANDVGEPVMISMEFFGVIQEIVDGSLLTGISYDTAVPAPLLGATSTVFGATTGDVCWSSFEISSNGTVAGRKCANSASGYRSFHVTNRRVSGTINPDFTVLSSLDPFTKLFAGTRNTFSVAWGSDSGNTCTIYGQSVQITSQRPETDEDILRHGLELQFCQPESSGTDEYEELKLTIS